MPNLLLIESSNEICSVALSQEKSIIQEKYINKPKEVIENIDEIKDLYDQTNLETEKNLYT